MYAHIYKVFMRIHVRLCGCAVDLASSPGDSRVGSAYVCGDHVCGDHEGKHMACVVIMRAKHMTRVVTMRANI